MAEVRLLVTGGSGMLGTSLVFKTRTDHDVYAMYYSDPQPIGGCEHRFLDLADERGVSAMVEEINPDVIVHAAALTDLDYCETHPDIAESVNVCGTGAIARAARQGNRQIIYISTDYVFDGTIGGYKETDKPNPLSVYAATKLRGEEMIQETCDDYAIIRTCIYGWRRDGTKSIAEWVLEKLRHHAEVYAFSDRIFTPIYVGHLSEVIMKIIGSRLTGTYHVGSRDKVSVLEFAGTLARVFAFKGAAIKPSKMADYPYIAKRPLDCSLDVTKIQEELGRPMPSVEDGLCLMRDEEGMFHG